MMARSLLYRLHSHKLQPGVEAPDDKFVEVYRSKYGFVRIYKIVGVSEESKAWAADPANRICDAPGSWFCRGQYPPGLSKVLARKKDFQQLEDFNRGPADEEYQKRYFEDLKNPDKAQKKVLEQEKKHRVVEEVEAKGFDDIYNTWEDTEDTTLMWKLISSNSYDELKAWLDEEPRKAFIRSRDGRGPMWWAFEQRNELY
jgi:dolichyl-diphosphooligosaccharide---protein glycosyltransferase